MRMMTWKGLLFVLGLMAVHSGFTMALLEDYVAVVWVIGFFSGAIFAVLMIAKAQGHMEAEQ